MQKRFEKAAWNNSPLLVVELLENRQLLAGLGPFPELPLPSLPPSAPAPVLVGEPNPTVSPAIESSPPAPEVSAVVAEPVVVEPPITEPVVEVISAPVAEVIPEPAVTEVAAGVIEVGAAVIESVVKVIPEPTVFEPVADVIELAVIEPVVEVITPGVEAIASAIPESGVTGPAAEVIQSVVEVDPEPIIHGPVVTEAVTELIESLAEVLELVVIEPVVFESVAEVIGPIVELIEPAVIEPVVIEPIIIEPVAEVVEPVVIESVVEVIEPVVVELMAEVIESAVNEPLAEVVEVIPAPVFIEPVVTVIEPLVEMIEPAAIESVVEHIEPVAEAVKLPVEVMESVVLESVAEIIEMVVGEPVAEVIPEPLVLEPVAEVIESAVSELVAELIPGQAVVESVAEAIDPVVEVIESAGEDVIAPGSGDDGSSLLNDLGVLPGVDDQLLDTEEAEAAFEDLAERMAGVVPLLVDHALQQFLDREDDPGNGQGHTVIPPLQPDTVQVNEGLGPVVQAFLIQGGWGGGEVSSELGSEGPAGGEEEEVPGGQMGEATPGVNGPSARGANLPADLIWTGPAVLSTDLAALALALEQFLTEIEGRLTDQLPSPENRRAVEQGGLTEEQDRQADSQGGADGLGGASADEAQAEVLEPPPGWDEPAVSTEGEVIPPLKILVGQMADLLADFMPIGLDVLDSVAQQFLDQAEDLAEDAERSLASLLALVAVAALVYEIARREMRQLPSEQAPAPDCEDPTAI